MSVISLFPQQNKEIFNDDINPGSGNGSVNEEVHSTANLLSQPRTHSQAQRKSARIQGRTQGEVAPVGRTRYINVPQEFEGILQAAGVVGMEGKQNTTTAKHTRKRKPTPDNVNLRHGKHIRTTTARFDPSKDGCAPDNDYSPPVVNSSIVFPIRVTREKRNCAFGNTVNLLTYINHFNTGLK